MSNIRCKTLLVAGSIVLAGCQEHLPPLEEGANAPKPKVTDAINEIQCELASIVNSKIDKSGPDPNPIYTFKDSDNPSIKKRAVTDTNLAGLIHRLVDDHFVASAQLTLDVTDTEGLTPSLSFMNSAATWAVGIGGQVNGTEDRSLSVNYIIDLASLVPDNGKTYQETFCLPPNSAKEPGAAGGAIPTIAGDLGLGDIVADGLISLDASKKYNLYGSTGPTPPTVAEAFDLANGQIKFSGQPQATITIESFAGSFVVSPQATGALTLGTVTMTGVADIVQNTTASGGQPASRIESKFIVNFSGNLLPPDGGPTNNFTLTGTISPVVSQSLNDTQQFINDWGFSPTLTINGSISNTYDPNTLTLAGVITAQSGSAYYVASAPPGTLSISASPSVRAPVGHGAPAAFAITPQVGGVTPVGGGVTPGGGKGSASSANSTGTTSFGSLVDFTLVYGLNGGPNWSFKRVKGPSGTSPFISLSRSHYDSLSITLVAACQNSAATTIATYWDSIGNCNVPRMDPAQAAYQAGTIQILRSLLQRSGAGITP